MCMMVFFYENRIKNNEHIIDFLIDRGDNLEKLSSHQ